jgi:hypothetical protein
VIVVATIQEALAEAQRLLAKPRIHGISIRNNRIIVYAEQGVSVPTSILGFPVEVVYTKKFEVL